MVKRRYERPPVIEALCEIYFSESRWDATVPGLFYERIRDRFPKKSQRSDLSIKVALAGVNPSTQTTPGEPRSQFSSEDGSRMVQVGRDLLVVNQLRPYPRFEKWRPVALEMTSYYRELAKPTAISKLGIRYINRIEIPGTSLSMEEYFQLYPKIPPELGGTHGSFMMRVEIPAPYPEHQLFVTFGSAPSETKGSLGFLLDFYDVFAVNQTDGFEEVEKALDQGHENIVRSFENTIADASRSLFGENKNGRTD